MIWIIGSRGMLGSEVARQLTQNKIPWIGTNSDIDITDYQILENFEKSIETAAYSPSALSFLERKIKWVILCSAFTKVDDAEENTEAAEKLNATGAQNVARLCRNIGAKLIYISTDYVYDGNKNSPYTEEDFVNPLNVYGKTKLAGEIAVQKQMNTYYIIRTSWLYGKTGNNFLLTMMNNLSSNNEVNVIKDQTGTPTGCEDLANVIIKLINKCDSATSLFGKNSAPNYGIYNYSNDGETSWYDYACLIQKIAVKQGLISNECKIVPCLTEDYPAKAKRPLYSVLDKTKISKALKIKIPNWKISLEKMIKGK